VGLGLLGGYNYFASLYYSTTGSKSHRKGLASGIHEATLSIGFAAGSMAGGVAGHLAGVRAPYVLGMAVIAFLVVIQIILYRKNVLPLRRGLLAQRTGRPT
jgi:predicted MFS family arabinose efflux permease